ncbi:MAG: hypothetical protein ABUL64_02395, partial [Singulisphaera sp.]
IVRNLVTNGWVCLVAWEDNKFYRWTEEETWELQADNDCAYARQYPDRRCVNAPALAAIIERGGTE